MVYYSADICHQGWLSRIKPCEKKIVKNLVLIPFDFAVLGEDERAMGNREARAFFTEGFRKAWLTRHTAQKARGCKTINSWILKAQQTAPDGGVQDIVSPGQRQLIALQKRLENRDAKEGSGSPPQPHSCAPERFKLAWLWQNVASMLSLCDLQRLSLYANSAAPTKAASASPSPEAAEKAMRGKLVYLMLNEASYGNDTMRAPIRTIEFDTGVSGETRCVSRCVTGTGPVSVPPAPEAAPTRETSSDDAALSDEGVMCDNNLKYEIKKRFPCLMRTYNMAKNPALDTLVHAGFSDDLLRLFCEVDITPADRLAVYMVWQDQGWGNQKGDLIAAFYKRLDTVVLRGGNTEVTEEDCEAEEDDIARSMEKWDVDCICRLKSRSEYFAEVAYRKVDGNEHYDKKGCELQLIEAVHLGLAPHIMDAQAWELDQTLVAGSDVLRFYFKVGSGGGHDFRLDNFRVCYYVSDERKL